MLHRGACGGPEGVMGVRGGSVAAQEERGGLRGPTGSYRGSLAGFVGLEWL